MGRPDPQTLPSACLSDIPMEKLMTGAFVRSGGQTYFLVKLSSLSAENITQVVTCQTQPELEACLKECLSLENGQITFNIAAIGAE